MKRVILEMLKNILQEPSSSLFAITKRFNSHKMHRNISI